MLEFRDFSITHFLDDLRAQYEAQGYRVSYLTFTYGVDFLPLAAGSVANLPVLIDHDSDFILTQQAQATYEEDGTGQQYPNLLVLLRVQSSQRQLMDQRTHITNVFGSAQRPHMLYKPLILPAKTSMDVELENLSQTDYNVRLSFTGVKAFLQG